MNMLLLVSASIAAVARSYSIVMLAPWLSTKSIAIVEKFLVVPFPSPAGAATLMVLDHKVTKRFRFDRFAKDLSSAAVTTISVFVGKDPLDWRSRIILIWSTSCVLVAEVDTGRFTCTLVVILLIVIFLPIRSS